jgi:hypothetical protein
VTHRVPTTPASRRVSPPIAYIDSHSIRCYPHLCPTQTSSLSTTNRKRILSLSVFQSSRPPSNNVVRSCAHSCINRILQERANALILYRPISDLSYSHITSSPAALLLQNQGILKSRSAPIRLTLSSTTIYERARCSNLQQSGRQITEKYLWTGRTN